ncbi:MULTISPECIES: SAF domain-containing protein [Rhodococcus]|uniref:Flagella basal body P-ring formation protein FlgA n=1 Tax=Rhodococcus oxybenzonivorans TaxID=1990687 RepID=A0AAE5A4Q4_9NOCA|nr:MULTISPECIES: SAF domain-containing protein [Rhodococcus]MDV7243929.1 flagella basal body P-ring formation protein FlgA [Rhodococcus oxybenzonivorans]MDV7263812.1 flagella basal body P-ring formation protein FlgA [Rhodococcus oxybenzonivorans]MDV7274829.1 flagella basal body P-ring formation protein FlgA [Rhodococcus oxybenzonivorans]MDV7335068.1 flagella basal body P-ring formation protein FlgA [Rhodococcus oxybenzonivorans]MDV7345779.1 flagella basal body P-ring formation protein FlgA [Rh
MSRNPARNRVTRAHRSLGPSWFDRLSDLTHPSWARTLVARRVAAAGLACLAVALGIRGDPDSAHSPVVVAVRDLQPGRILVDTDLEVRQLEVRSLPDGAVSALSDVSGRTLASPARAGETLTDVRVLGPRLAATAAGIEDARIVPVRLADPAVAELLREGDRVDVLTVDSDTPAHSGRPQNATVLASDAVVVLVTPSGNGRDQRDRVVMLALPATEATTVAAASLTNAITVTFQ